MRRSTAAWPPELFSDWGYVTQLELADVVNPPRTAERAPLLAFANPDGSLPAATREVRALARVRPGVTSFDGAEATKARFVELSGRFPDLHLATHGVLDPKWPARSHLLFAGEDDRSRRLEIDEIVGLNLRNGLVVLSACETALGEQVPGAALVTMAAAFSQAGSQSIVASLWKVDDVATRDFMVELHLRLEGGSRAQAFQAAQAAVLSNPETAHPFYWAAFLLIGAR